MKRHLCYLFAFALLSFTALSVAAPPWSPQQVLNSDWPNDNLGDYYPSVAMAPNGTAICAWGKGGYMYANQRVLVARSTDRGTTWSNQVDLFVRPGLYSSIANTPQVATDGKGKWIVAWTQYTASPNRVWYARSEDDGLTWSPAAEIDANVTGQLSIATDGSGNWMIMAQAIGAGGGIRIGRSSDHGASFSFSNIPLAPGRSGNLAFPAVASNRAGRWIMTWGAPRMSAGVDPRDQCTYVSYSDDFGDSWSPSYPLAGSESYAVLQSWIDCDSSGNWAVMSGSYDISNLPGYNPALRYPTIFVSHDNAATWMPGKRLALGYKAYSIAAGAYGTWIALVGSFDSPYRLWSHISRNDADDWTTLSQVGTGIQAACVATDREARWLAVSAMPPGPAVPQQEPEILYSFADLSSAADVKITKQHQPVGDLRQEEQITYIIQFTNAGPDTATSVTVTDHLPPGFVVTSVWPPTTISPVQGDKVVFRYPRLPVGMSQEFRVTGHYEAGMTGDMANIATITAREHDPAPADNVAADTVRILPGNAPEADIKVFKQHQPAGDLAQGQEVTYKIQFVNSGPDEATSVTVTDHLPPGFVVTSVWPATSISPIQGDKVVFRYPRLPVGITHEFRVTGSYETGVLGEVENIATITARENDPNPADNVATDTVKIIEGNEPVDGPDLTIELISATRRPFRGRTQVTLTYSVSNIGNKRARASYSRFYIGNNDTLGSDDQVVARQFIPALEPGTSTPPRIVRFLMPPIMTLNLKYFVGQADVFNWEPEVDETNNTDTIGPM